MKEDLYMLILSGGGAGAQTKELYEFYSSAIDYQQPILYIPVAIPMDDYSGCLHWIKKELGVYGLTNIDMVSDIESLNALDFMPL